MRARGRRLSWPVSADTNTNWSKLISAQKVGAAVSVVLRAPGDLEEASDTGIIAFVPFCWHDVGIIM